MTEYQFKEKINLLTVEISTEILKLSKDVNINLSDFGNDYSLPKSVVHAILKKLSEDYRPLNSVNREISEKLYKSF